jgi:hypothetical protein
MNNHMILMDLRRHILTREESTNSQHQSVSAALYLQKPEP